MGALRTLAADTPSHVGGHPSFSQFLLLCPQCLSRLSLCFECLGGQVRAVHLVDVRASVFVRVP